MAVLSEEAKARKREYWRERYQWYRSHGICFRCYGWAEPGSAYCKDCKNKERIRLKKKDPDGSINRQRCKERRERLKAEGRCVNCGKKAVPGQVLCATCKGKHKESNQVCDIRDRIAKETKTQWKARS